MSRLSALVVAFLLLFATDSWTAETIPEEPMLIEEDSEERRRSAEMFSRPTLYGVAVTRDGWILRIGNAVLCIR